MLALLLLSGAIAFLSAFAWLRQHGLLCAGVAAFLCAVSIARRRTLQRAEFARSWLAAVPVKTATARWEAFLIETLPASAAIAIISLAAVVALSAAAWVAWSYISAGIVAGVLLSFLVPRPKAVDLPPGSRYVPQPKFGRTTAIRPSLSALGHWPIRQMFAWAQPKTVARATIPIFVMLPMGTTADAAMIAIALFGVLGVLSLLCSAMILVSRLARRWLAPLPAHAGAVIRAILLPACGVIAGAGAIEALLLWVLRRTL